MTVKPDNDWGARIVYARPFELRRCMPFHGLSPWGDASQRLLELERGWQRLGFPVKR